MALGDGPPTSYPILSCTLWAAPLAPCGHAPLPLPMLPCPHIPVCRCSMCYVNGHFSECLHVARRTRLSPHTRHQLPSRPAPYQALLQCDWAQSTPTPGSSVGAQRGPLDHHPLGWFVPAPWVGARPGTLYRRTGWSRLWAWEARRLDLPWPTLTARLGASPPIPPISRSHSPPLPPFWLINTMPPPTKSLM